MTKPRSRLPEDIGDKFLPQATSRHDQFPGFTYVELIVAISIAAGVLTAAVMAFGTISGTKIVSIRSENITLGTSVLTNFFASTNPLISVPQAPNYGALAQAEIMRERLHQDLSSSVASFLLGRDGLNSTRVETITFTNDGRTIMTPMAFRGLLTNSSDFSSSATNALQTVNSSLYILNASTTNDTLRIRCVYETDFVPIASPLGVYASVRRYQGVQLTDYYHIFYPGQTNTFRPAGYVFNRGTVNGVNVSRPFYLLWWPDPLARLLPSVTSGGQARAGYTNMANQTPYFFVIPAFPAL